MGIEKTIEKSCLVLEVCVQLVLEFQKDKLLLFKLTLSVLLNGGKFLDLRLEFRNDVQLIRSYSRV